MLMQWMLTRTFLKLFLRDRQAIFFSLFFPVLFMVIFGIASDRPPRPVDIGIVNTQTTAYSDAFVSSLQNNPAFTVTTGDEDNLQHLLMEGSLALVLIVPEQLVPDGQTNGQEPEQTELTVLVDASQVGQLNLVLPALEQGLVQLERDLRGQGALFNLQVQDVQARSQRYIDFLVPGLLAMSLLSLSLAGSAFNIVEYRRKGILKRLFVTPLQPRDFIVGLVLSRGLICIGELALLLLIAWLYLNIIIVGNLLLLLPIVVMGAAVFLSMGFCVGSVAKSQQTVGALGNLVILPQIFLSGIFYPIDALPGLLQPIASALPLSFVANAMRSVMVDGASLPALLPDFLGMAVWLLICLFAAVRLFVWKDIAA